MRCLFMLRQQWRKFRERGFYEMLLVEEKREKRRIKMGRWKVMDIFWYSSSEDYYTLRLLYNYPIGFGLSFLIYWLAWYRINFADEDPFWGDFFKWLMICSAGMTYALNPLVRASLALALLAGLNSTGQGIISVFVLENLADKGGPIMNILHNFNVSIWITVCHLDLQAKISRRRIELQAGPLEALFEKNFGNATTIGKKVIKSLRSLIQPFDEEMGDETEEDAHLEAIIDTAKQLVDRQINAEKPDSETDGKLERVAKPAWKRLKSQLGQAVARRFERRCKYLFASSMDACHKKFEESQSLCYKHVPWPLGYFTCSRMNAFTLCQPGKVNEMSTKFCELGQGGDASREEHETLFSPELDDEMSSMQNVSKQIERQLQLNLHFQAVEQPELEKGYSLNQLKDELRHDVVVLQTITKTAHLIMGFIIVFFTYAVFKGSVNDTLCYLNDIEYRNYFTTRYFWRIDAKRKSAKKAYLSPLRKEELKHNKLSSPFGLPREDELGRMGKAFFRWSVLAFVILVVMMVDHYLFRMLEIVVTHGKMIRHQRGAAELYIEVKGTGAIPDLLRNVLNLNYSQKLEEHWSNLHCLEHDTFQPKRPDWEYNTLRMMIPLLAMLLAQVIFNFVVLRLALFYVLGLMFPRRAKARIIYMHNRMIFARVNMDKIEEGKRKDQEERDKKKEEEEERKKEEKGRKKEEKESKKKGKKKKKNGKEGKMKMGQEKGSSKSE